MPCLCSLALGGGGGEPNRRAGSWRSLQKRAWRASSARAIAAAVGTVPPRASAAAAAASRPQVSQPSGHSPSPGRPHSARRPPWAGQQPGRQPRRSSPSERTSLPFRAISAHLRARRAPRSAGASAAAHIAASPARVRLGGARSANSGAPSRPWRGEGLGELRRAGAGCGGRGAETSSAGGPSQIELDCTINSQIGTWGGGRLGKASAKSALRPMRRPLGAAHLRRLPGSEAPACIRPSFLASAACVTPAKRVRSSWG